MKFKNKYLKDETYRGFNLKFKKLPNGCLAFIYKGNQVLNEKGKFFKTKGMALKNIKSMIIYRNN